MKTYNHFTRHAVGILLITLLNLLAGGIALAADPVAPNSLTPPVLTGEQVVPSQNTRQKMPHADRKAAAKHLIAHYKMVAHQTMHEHVKKHHGFSGEGLHGDHGYQGGRDHLGDSARHQGNTEQKPNDSNSKKRGGK